MLGFFLRDISVVWSLEISHRNEATIREMVENTLLWFCFNILSILFPLQSKNFSYVCSKTFYFCSVYKIIASLILSSKIISFLGH